MTLTAPTIGLRVPFLRSQTPAVLLFDVTRTPSPSFRPSLPPCAAALVHAGLAEAGAAFEALERALTARDVHLAYLPHGPKWQGLRADPRFAALVARCGF